MTSVSLVINANLQQKVLQGPSLFGGCATFSTVYLAHCTDSRCSRIMGARNSNMRLQLVPHGRHQYHGMTIECPGMPTSSSLLSILVGWFSARAPCDGSSIPRVVARRNRHGARRFLRHVADGGGPVGGTTLPRCVLGRMVWVRRSLCARFAGRLTAE